MLRISFLIWLCISLLNGSAQHLGDLHVIKGFDNYRFQSGLPIDSALQLATGGKQEYKDKVETTYVYKSAAVTPYDLGNVSFKNILLTYESNKLIRITLIKIYTPYLFNNFSSLAEQELQLVYNYLRNQWNHTAKKKESTPVPGYLVKSYNWAGQERKTKLILTRDPEQNYSLEVSLEVASKNK